MDVDGDIDGPLLQQFLSMGTQDKEVLVSEFQKLLGNQLNPAACAFFLDMNNWNLQAAVGSYYDFEHPVTELPCMTFVKDITIGDGESVRPGVNFLKTWRIKNTGNQVWPPGCSLKFTLGHQLGSTDRVMVDALAPGAECDVSVPMTSPSTPGMYEGQWRMSTPTGSLYGDTIWVIVQVAEDGLLDITQDMYRFGGLGSHQTIKSPSNESGTNHDSTSPNPFGSPSKLYKDNSGSSTSSNLNSTNTTNLTFTSPHSNTLQHSTEGLQNTSNLDRSLGDEDML